MAFDKHRLIENQSTSIVAKLDDMKALADQFRLLSEQWREKQVNVMGEAD